jgi:hypothetical protein
MLANPAVNIRVIRLIGGESEKKARVAFPVFSGTSLYFEKGF